MAHRTCTIDGCNKPHRAKGLCSSHYNQSMPREKRHPKVTLTCFVCGIEVPGKFPVSSGRRAVCSEDCKYVLRWGYRREDKPRPKRELLGPIRVTKTTTAPVTVIPSSRYGYLAGQCAWCRESFAFDRNVTTYPARYCSLRCGRKAGKARREQQHGRFAISPAERLAIYERDAWTCQLCHEPVDPSLHWSDSMAASLDHIECQSWSLIPDHSPSNLRTAHRLCNSIRGDERWTRAA